MALSACGVIHMGCPQERERDGEHQSMGEAKLIVLVLDRLLRVYCVDEGSEFA